MTVLLLILNYKIEQDYGEKDRTTVEHVRTNQKKKSVTTNPVNTTQHWQFNKSLQWFLDPGKKPWVLSVRLILCSLNHSLYVMCKLTFSPEADNNQILCLLMGLILYISWAIPGGKYWHLDVIWFSISLITAEIEHRVKQLLILRWYFYIGILF